MKFWQAMKGVGKVLLGVGVGVDHVSKEVADTRRELRELLDAIRALIGGDGTVGTVREELADARRELRELRDAVNALRGSS